MGAVMDNGVSRPIAATMLMIGSAATVFYLVSSISDLGGSLLYEDRIGGAYVGDVVYMAPLALAAVACLLRGLLASADRIAWLLIGVGACCWLAGEVGFAIEVNATGSVSYPSPADALFLAQYPLTLAGILLLLRGRFERRNPRAWLDGLIGFGASAALGVALLGPVLVDVSARRLAATLTNLAYPLVDVLLIAVIFGAIGLLGRSSLDRAFAMLLAALATIAVADGVFLYLEATGAYYDVHPVDAIWMLAAVLLTTAASLRPAPIEHRLAAALRVVGPLLLAVAAIVVVAVSGEISAADGWALYLAALTMLAVVGRLLLTLRDNDRLLAASRLEADTDALTGLGNRRRLRLDLEAAAADAAGGGPGLLVAIYDLDGFKSYNDSFGHAAGDALLRRFGLNLRQMTAGSARTYRLGGDEFCLLAREDEGKPEAAVAAGSSVLSERGQGFEIGSSVGSARVPTDTLDASEALQIADRRMYAAKGRRIELPEQQARNLLMQVLQEREPAIGTHVRTVSDLARDLARRVGVQGEELDLVVRCAELHDIGKMAIPDAIIHKAGPLTDEEWELMRKHTLVGERIVAATPALREVGRLIRSSHERWDGGGYPDGLAGEEIPLGSRITLICDAFESMVGERAYDPPRAPSEALAELRRNAGTQFDAELVEVFCEQVVATAPELPAVGP